MAKNDVEQVVFAVHAVRPHEIAATAYLTADQSAAEEYAAEMSNDPGILAAAVTRFVLDAHGRRTALALFVKGERQQVPHISDDRRINANGHGSASRYAPR